MVRILPPLLTALAAGIPAQGSAMPNHGAAPGNAVAQAAQGPVPTAVSAAANPAPFPATPATDTPAEARGRKILSTAFVRVGPDGQITVELQGGRVLVLRNVALRARDYCGQVLGDTPGKRHCGGYADVMAARPGGGEPRSGTMDTAVANPLSPKRGSMPG